MDGVDARRNIVDGVRDVVCACVDEAALRDFAPRGETRRREHQRRSTPSLQKGENMAALTHEAMN